MLRIKRELFERGISQAEVAREAHINAASLSRICNGHEPAYRQRGERIAEAIGWQGDPAELFEEVDG